MVVGTLKLVLYSDDFDLEAGPRQVPDSGKPLQYLLSIIVIRPVSPERSSTMPDTCSHSYIDAHGPDQTALRRGFQWLQDLAAGDPDKAAALVVVPQMANLTSMKDNLTAVIGEANTKEFVKGESVTVGGATISVMTTKNAVASWDGPVLVIYPRPTLLDQVDALSGKTDVLVIPWVRQEVQPWIDKHGASSLP